MVPKKILKLLDANLNRSTEGLRVIEDTFRFVINNPKYFKKIRKIRHKLSEIFKHSKTILLQNRSVSTDPGRTVQEKKNKTVDDILAANFQRIQQSLRVLEEYSQIINLNPKTIKKLRFQVYNVEKQTMLELKSFHRS